METNRKPLAFELLKAGVPVKEIMKQTGYSQRRVYDFKKEVENSQPPQATDPPATEIAPLQLQNTSNIEKELIEILQIIKGHLQTELNEKALDCLLMITRHLYEPPNNEGTPVRTGTDDRQATEGTSSNVEDFTALLTRTSNSPSKTD